jgi:hypothetical protein
MSSWVSSPSASRRSRRARACSSSRSSTRRASWQAGGIPRVYLGADDLRAAAHIHGQPPVDLRVCLILRVGGQQFLDLGQTFGLLPAASAQAFEQYWPGQDGGEVPGVRVQVIPDADGQREPGSADNVDGGPDRGRIRGDDGPGRGPGLAAVAGIGHASAVDDDVPVLPQARELIPADGTGERGDAQAVYQPAGVAAMAAMAAMAEATTDGSYFIPPACRPGAAQANQYRPPGSRHPFDARSPRPANVPRYTARQAGAMYLACTSDAVPMHPGYTCTARSCQSAAATGTAPQQGGYTGAKAGVRVPAATGHLQSQRILLSQRGQPAPCRARPRCSEPRYLGLSR